jgi:glycosyltransferase involved in cell wall biosynthesis
MRVAVYDQFWPTLGGGERFAAGIAEVLAGAGHDVVLLAHEPLDLDVLGERLGLDVGGLSVELVEALPDAVSEASAHVDLFVNASFMSSVPSRAERSIYVVHFPTVPRLQRSPLRRAVAERGRRLLGAGEPLVEPVGGLHSPDVLRRHSVRWTTGEARFAVTAPPGERVPVAIALGRYADRSLGTIPVRAEIDGEQVATVDVAPVHRRWDPRRVTHLRFTVEGRPDGAPVELVLRSPSHRPADVDRGADNRVLGVPVLTIEAGSGLGRRLAGALPGLIEPVQSLGFLDTYTALVSNSAFTRRWVARLWDRDTGLLFPPVGAVRPAAKVPSILSVGRFFPRGSGHSKKQLEMVRAFRSLFERGLQGWTLHLVGGCEERGRPYLEEVRAAAEGLPVRLHVGATGAELRALYGQASIYWHATGLDEDEDRHPDRFEHFGITTVEAMSAGAVPVVIGAAGQAEVVRDGVDGLLFGDQEALVDRTWELVADPDRLSALSVAARTRAADFGPEAFSAAVLALVAEVTHQG